MSKMERIDSRSATSAPDDVTTPAIARAAKQPSAPAVRDEAPEVLPKGKGGGAGEQLLPNKTEPQSNPASIRGPATEDQVQRPLAKEAREGGPVPQDRQPDGANSPADKPDGDLRAGDQSGDQVRRSPLRRHPIAVLIGLIFLAGRRLIGLKNRVDDRNQRPELRPLWSLGPHITGRRRIPAHLGDRIPVKTRAASRLLFLSTNTNRRTAAYVSTANISGHPSESDRKGSAPKVAGFYSATQPQNAAAPWPTIAPPRTPSPTPAIDFHLTSSDMLSGSTSGSR
jgi:hypothetical protein